MADNRSQKTSERRQIRDAYITSGRVPLGMMLRVGLRDLLIQPFWLPLKYMPGAVGMKIRQLIYRLRLDQLGTGSLVDLGVEIATPKSIQIGRFSLIDKYCSLLPGEGRITIGDRCHIAPWVTILGHANVTVGDYISIASGAKIYSISEWPGDGKRLAGPMIPQDQRGLRMGPINIERDVLVGAQAVIMPGVTIGEGAVVGANSVVTHDVPPWTIVAGLPAKPIGKRDPVTVEDLP